MAVCLFMIYGLPGDTKVRWIIWFLLGLGAYFLYARKHARTPDYALKR
jgi:APA family basic amino acid/polyamine antiporter